jgi:hypothetical protein
MRIISLKPSDRKGKKYTVVMEANKRNHTIHFGAKGYTDYTINKSDAKKQAYLARHSATEDWSDPLTAGFWSRWLLWNKLTIRESLADIRRRFGI